MTEKKIKRAVIKADDQLLNDISDLIKSKSDVLLKNILADIYPSDIAQIINNLNVNDGLELFKMLNASIAAEVILQALLKQPSRTSWGSAFFLHLRRHC